MSVDYRQPENIHLLLSCSSLADSDDICYTGQMNTYLLQDPRLHHDIPFLAGLYIQQQVEAGAVSNYKGYNKRNGVDLVLRRAMKALIAGKPLPGDITTASKDYGVQPSDLGPIYQLLNGAIHRHLQQCEVAFGDIQMQQWKQVFPASAAVEKAYVNNKG